MRRSSQRCRGDRGIALVEAVFVFPIVLTIVFAIFEFGLLFAAQSTTQSATRDGVRFGAANFAVSGNKQAAADAIAAAVANDLSARLRLDTPLNLVIYKAQSNGQPTGGFSSCSADCFKYTWNGTGWTPVAGSPAWTVVSACLSGTGLNTLDSIGAYLEVRHSYITSAFGSSTMIQESTVTRLEPLPASQC